MTLFISPLLLSSAGTSESTHKTVNLALCGFGRAGHMHIASIRRSNRCRLRYIVDVAGTQDTIQKFLEEWDMTSTKFVSAADFDTVVLQDRELQAVMITTTTCVHEQYVRKSLRAGKAVFCEKPIAATLEATKACYKEASDAGLPLLCAFNRRFDPGFKRVVKQVREGKIGKVHMIKTTSRDYPPPPMEYLRQSSGMFHDCAVHDLDVVCWILGETPVEVYAQGTAQHPEIAAMNDVDTIAIVLKFPSGTLATIDLSRHSSYGYDQRLEVRVFVCVSDHEHNIALFSTYLLSVLLLGSW